MEKKKTDFFENPIFRTKIKSAVVKPNEMFIGYFVAPFMALISNAIFASYLNRYYSDVIGWTDKTKFGVFSALLPIVSVIFVVLGNLLVGRIMDETRTSQGKARPIMLLSAPLVTIAVGLLFLTPQNASPLVQMIWMAFSYNMYYAIAYPLYYTSHSSMVNLSTRDQKKRGLLATLSNASGVASLGIGSSILVPILLQSYLFVETDGVIDQELSYQHWRVVMIVLCVLTFVGIMLEYYNTRERITEENIRLDIKEEKLPMKQQIASCIKEKYWWLIILYFLLFQFGGLVKNGSMSYYCRWMFDGITTEAAAGTAMGTLGLIGGIPTAIGMVLAWPIASKLGKQRSIVLGLLLSVIGGSVSFIDVHDFVTVCIGVILKGIGSIPAMYVTLALLSDVLDHLEAKNGFRSDGFTMSVYGAIMVGMTGLGNGIINALLTASGYDATAAVQNESVGNMLVICYLGVELVCYAILVVLMSFLKVEKEVEEDQKTIRARQKAQVLAEGREWIEPEEQMRREQEAAEKEAEEERIKELHEYCDKKGLSFEEEERKYQEKKS
ncbi:MAG: MFS transporter, partial [Lachnospiraceae bacterium]|nr:MFS transporter [Lachnospiraceae bacterium]